MDQKIEGCKVLIKAQQEQINILEEEVALLKQNAENENENQIGKKKITASPATSVSQKRQICLNVLKQYIVVNKAS